MSGFGLKQKNTFLLSILVLALLGTAAVLILTRWGPGLFDWDSFNYLSSARQFAQGHGLQIQVAASANRPLVHFPPLFPITLAVFEFLHLDGISGARFFNAIMFAVNLGLFAYIVYEATRSPRLTFAAALLFLLSADLLIAHAWVLSEPLLIGFFLAAFVFFQKWLATRRNYWVGLIYGCIVLSVLTKFVGVAIAPAVALLFLASDLQWKNKLALAFGAGLAGLLPFAAWSVRSLLLTSTLNGRGLSYAPIGMGNLVTGFYTLFTWVFPRSWLVGRERIFLLIGLALLVALAGYVLFRSWGPLRPASSAIVFALALWGSYGSVVLVAKLFVDHGIGFQSRMFIPLYPWFLFLILFCVYDLLQSTKLAGRLASISIVLFVALVSLYNLATKLPEVYENGLGWNRRAIVTAESVHRLKEIASQPGNRLFSNELYGLYFHTGRARSWLNDFPPQDEVGPTYLIIFKEHLSATHPLIERHATLLEPVIEDDVLAIFRLLQP